MWTPICDILNPYEATIDMIRRGIVPTDSNCSLRKRRKILNYILEVVKRFGGQR
jgi:hypothetical protein